MTDLTEIAAFDQAFVATRSLLGGTAEGGHSAEDLALRLGTGDQKTRATALAKALAPIAVALERRRP